jgi:hypothetical protein
VLISFLIAWTVTHGVGYWLTLKAIAALPFGIPALFGGPWVLLAGFLIHFGMSMFFGVLFATGLAMLGIVAFGGPFWMVVRNPLASVPIAAGLGIIYGVAIWAVMNFGILPPTDPIMAWSMTLIFYAFYVAHLVFGVGLVSVPLILSALVGPSMDG